MRLLAILLWIVVLNVSSYGQSFSESKFAVGSQFGLAAIGVSVKYWITPTIGLQTTYGRTSFSVKEEHSVRTDFNEEDILSAWDIGGRFLYRILQEENMNAYFGVGISRIKASSESKSSFPGSEDSKDDISIFGMEAIAGAEWSFSEIPHLAFFSELGFARLRYTDEDDYQYYDSVTDTFKTETRKYTLTFDGIPSLFAKGGVFFYF